MEKRIIIMLALFFWVIPYFSYANLNDKRVISWNLQGASHSTESKWSVNVATLLRGGPDHQNVDIINIQEAGSPPPPASAILMQPLGTRLDNPDHLTVPVEEYEWDLGTRYRRNSYYIYFSRVDTGTNRVNLAIISRQRASRVIILGTSVFAAGHGRPVLGIEVDNSYYFNIHAIANGGSDSGVVTARVWEYFNQNNNQSSWMITGDFNRNPFGTNGLQGLLTTRYPNVAQNVTIVSQNSWRHKIRKYMGALLLNSETMLPQ